MNTSYAMNLITGNVVDLIYVLSMFTIAAMICLCHESWVSWVYRKRA